MRPRPAIRTRKTVRRQYLQSREAMGQLESAALEDQALDWVLTQVKVIDVPSSFCGTDRLWPA